MDKSEQDQLIDENTDHQADAIELKDDDVVEVNHEPQVVVKKSGVGFSLLLSLLALLATAYLYYLNWNQPVAVDSVNTQDVVLKALQDADQVLRTDLTNTQVDLASVNQQFASLQAEVKQQLNQVNSQSAIQSSNSTDSVQEFDNSMNQQSIDQLTNQLNSQAQLITQLQNQLSSNQSSPVAHELLPENDELRQKRLAVAVLNKLQLLLDTQRLSLAIESLDEFLKVTEIKPVYKSQLEQLSHQLKGVAVPDVGELKQQLTTLKTAVDAFTLNTSAAPKEEGSWYSQLITVKKIANDEAINSTAKLLEFKTELKQALYQAGLFLTLSDQLGWSNSLSDAANLMTEQMPVQKKMIQQLQQMSQLAVAIELPSNIDIQSLIDELKGLR